MAIRTSAKSLAAVALFAAIAVAGTAHAQSGREFVEEIEAPAPKPPDKNVAGDTNLDDGKPAVPPPTGTPPAATPPAATPPAATPPAATPPAATPPAATSPAVAAESLPSDVEVRLLSYQGLLETWDGRADALKKREIARVKRQDALLDQAFVDFGVHGVPGGAQAPGMGAALVVESRAAQEAGDAEAAIEAAEKATHTAPDLAAVHFHRAELLWSANKDFAGAVRGAGRGVLAAARDPLTATTLAARVLAILALSVLVLVIVFGVTGFLRALPYATFDVHNALPRGAAAWQVQALLVLVAFLPVVLGAGALLIALWLATLAWLYLDRRERGVVLVLGVLAALLPFAASYEGRLWAYPGSRAEAAARALTDVGAEQVRQELLHRPAAELGTVEAAALASAAKREGRLDEAFDRWRGLVQKLPDAGWTHTNFGVTAALLGKEELALAELQGAMQRDPASYEAAFDESLIHLRATRNQKGQQAVEIVALNAPDRLADFRRVTFHQPDQIVAHNRAFVDAGVPQRMLLEDALVQSQAAIAIEEDISRVLFLGLPRGVATGVLGAFPLLWFLLAALSRRILPSHACVRCRSPASRRYDGVDVPKGMCSACFHAFVSTKTRVDAGVKIRKERQIVQRTRALARIVRALSIPLPGVGHVWGGAPIQGGVFAALTLVSGAALALAAEVLPMPRLAGLSTSIPAIVVAGAIFVLIVLLAWRSAFSLASDFDRSTGRR